MTEIEQCRNSIKEYRKGYGQTQLKDDCIIQLMIGHHQSRVNAISEEMKNKYFGNIHYVLDDFKEQLLKQKI